MAKSIALLACLLVALPLFSVEMAGYQNGKPSAEAAPQEPGAATPTGDVAAPESGQLYDKQLDVHFNYPMEMRALDANADIDSGHESLYGVSGDDDAEHQLAKRCTRIILDADLPEDKAPQRSADFGNIWIDDTKEYKESRQAEPIFAKILVMEFLQECVPKKQQKNAEGILAGLALEFASEPGIQRMGKPLWFEVAGQKFHMNCGVGRPIVNGQPAPAPIIIMAMATQWRGHFLTWVFFSDDAQTFNEMTKSLVQFGAGRWGTMFAANIGADGEWTGMATLPK